jgi:Carboxypeptidase regulatory-like domain
MLPGFLKHMRRGASILVFILFSIEVSGQNARFAGQVTDAQNAAIPKATVEVTNQDTGVQLQTVTDDSGNYSIPYLTAGRYRVVVQAQGFNLSAHDVTLGMGQALIVNVQLEVAGARTTVSVQAGSELTELHLETSEISGTITGKEVAAIQLNGRNFSQLIALAPGVSNQTQQDEARVGMAGSVSYSVNGGRTEYNSFQADGSELLNVGINKDHTSLIVTPSIDAIQEIKVLTSNYGAMYPSTGNGTTIVTTKSGSDSYHGSLYEFFRNEDLNAKGYFDIGTSAPLYRRNDFGGTIGGPLSIPHIYDAKGKTHFFFSEEARIEKDPYAYRQAVPSLEERNGDFSDVCPPLANGEITTFSRTKYPDCPSPYGNFTFVNNQINYPLPQDGLGPFLLNQNATAILNTGIIPLPNATTGCNTTGSSCYLAEVSLPTYWREELFRIDHALNSRLQAGFRYIHDEWDDTTPVPVYAYTQNSFPTIQNRFYAPGTSLAARFTAAFSTTFLNEFVASYTDSSITLRDMPGPGASLARPAGLDAPCSATDAQCSMTMIFNNGAKGIDGVPKIPGVSIAGNNGEYGGFGFAADPAYMPWQHTNPVYSFSDNLDKFIGRHNLQFGVQWIVFQRNQTNGPIGAATGDTQGLLTFSNIGTNSGTGNAFANFLFTQPEAPSSGGPYTNGGYISSFQQDSGQAWYRQRYQIVEPYFQDDFKISPRLTLNLGLRLSLFGTYREANNLAYNWEPSAFSMAAAKTVQVGQIGNLVEASDQAPILINQSNPQDGLDPRVINGIVQCGVNGRPSSCMSGHLLNPAPRVGFAWDPLGSGKIAIRGGYGIFFEHGTADEANTGSLEAAAPMVLSMTQSFPYGWSTIGGGNAFPINVTAIPTKAVWPYVQQWSLSVERQLPRNALATVAYVGSAGHHLTAELEINQLAPLAASQNPFAAHVPMLTQGQNPAVAGINFTGDCTHSSPEDPSFTLRSGAVVSPGTAAYTSMFTACLGNGAGGQANALRTFAPGIGQIYSLENVANSAYNSLQATLRKVRGPLTIGVAYTYSHSLDNASDRSDATFVNSFDLASNRASSNFDQRHLLHVSYIYDLPLVRVFDALLHFADDDPTNVAANYPGHPYDANAWSSSKAVKAVLGGWQLSGLTLVESGIPFTVVNNGSPTGVSTLDNAGVANGVGSGSYPDLSGISAHSRLPAGGKNGKSFGPLILNPIAFIAPQGLTFGNAGRNGLNNPLRVNWDMALMKHFPLRESLSADFRAEAFNLFNHTQFRIYDPLLGPQAQNEVSCYGGDAAYYSAAGGDGVDCLTGSSFLHPVDAHRPRTIQVALRLTF